MKALIIGGKGFVGPYLTKELRDANYEVLSVDIPEFNLLDKNAVNNLIKKETPEYIINLAAISSVSESWKNPTLTIQVNVEGTVHLLDAVSNFSPQSKMLLIGSAEEYARSTSKLSENSPLEASNPYGISKIAQENFAKLYRQKYGLDIICTRSFNHTGINQSERFALPYFIKEIAKIEKTKNKSFINVGNLNSYRDFSDVRDVVHAYRMLLEKETNFDIYNVGSGNAYKIGDLLQTIINFSSVKITVVPDKEKFRPIENPYQCADNTRIKELGIWKNTPIKETLKWMFDYAMTNF